LRTVRPISAGSPLQRRPSKSNPDKTEPFLIWMDREGGNGIQAN
jgi:hypothetical protein